VIALRAGLVIGAERDGEGAGHDREKVTAGWAGWPEERGP